MTGLPKLPGLVFSDPTINKFHVPHKFEFVNGYRIPVHSNVGIGGRELDANSVGYIAKKDPIRYDPSLTYGRVRGPTLPQFLPHYALYDQKCLTFKAFFKQTVVDSPDEHYRIRAVNIIYFLQDDTITVMEPFVRNCGFQQGRLVRRSRIPKNEDGKFWHWKDLNVGIDICFNSIVFHTVDCDNFTKEYMASQGIEVNQAEDMPPDPYIMNREFKMIPNMTVTPPADDKLRRFLEFDGKILRFFAVWDDRDSEYGDLKECIIFYFLSDDTIAIKEVHKPNDGCDPYPLLLRKTKLPKNWTDRPVNYPACFLELSENEVTEYYQPKDMRIGETIFVMGRRILIYDCDQFTRNYYEKILRIEQGKPIHIQKDTKPQYGKVMPPHGGLALGTLEDSLQNCFQTIPTRPRQDEVCMIMNANKYLRYTMDLDWVHPEDSIRKFILLYSLADGKLQIYEPPIRNSGIIGGQFLKNMLIAKPNTDPLNTEYYTPGDFYVGAMIFVHGHRFIITGADLMVYRYMQANPEKFSKDVISNVRNYMFNQGYLKDDVKEKLEENQEEQRKEEIDAIGKHLEAIKTEREKCIEKLMVQHGKESDEVHTKYEPILDKQKLPYDKEVKKYGIKEINKECAYPVEIGNIPDSACPSSNKEIFYPDTEEEKLEKYYKDVLRRHEEACMKSAEYKKYNECLPGTANIRNKELGKHVLVSEIPKPQPEKYNQCLDKKVTFFESPDKCKQDKEDVSNLKLPKTACDCTEFKQN